MHDVVISGLFEVGQYDLLRIGLRVGPALSKNAGGPKAQHFVAARRCLETKLLVMRELLFEAFFALVECCGHAALFDFDSAQLLQKTFAGFARRACRPRLSKSRTYY